MNYILLSLLFSLSGFFMKFSDDLYDINRNTLLATVFGLLCGVLSAMASISDVGAAYIFISILIGNLFAFKVDGVHHIFTLIVFVVILLVYGIPDLSMSVLLIMILSALLDEVGHEAIGNLTGNRFFNFFFEYRFVMKFAVLLLAVYGVFSLWVFVFFLLFEIFYEVAGIVKKIS